MAIGDEWDAVDDATPGWARIVIPILGGLAMVGFALLVAYLLTHP